MCRRTSRIMCSRVTGSPASRMRRSTTSKMGAQCDVLQGMPMTSAPMRLSFSMTP